MRPSPAMKAGESAPLTSRATSSQPVAALVVSDITTSELSDTSMALTMARAIAGTRTLDLVGWYVLVPHFFLSPCDLVGAHFFLVLYKLTSNYLNMCM
jgi:hypothetical protein